METATRSQITLKGSTDTVVEFFGHSIHSILYQRAVYPPEDFKVVKAYGLQLLASTDEMLNKYLSDVLVQLKEWIMQQLVQRLVLVISNVETGDVLERWQFDLEVQATEEQVAAQPAPKTDKEVQAEIQAVMRQITSCVTFLPVLEDRCSFDLLVYTKNDAVVPAAWEHSDGRYIQNSEVVRLRSFSTSIHKVSTAVAYRSTAA